MRYKRLGTTDLQVSVIGLGTQFWGAEIPTSQALEQIDSALEQGINLIDTAEIYPVPYSASTWGNSETIIGEWISRNNGRNRIILATKIAGRSRDFRYIRDGHQKLDRTNIFESVDTSLKRLQSDHIDLIQLHWPDRNTNILGQLTSTYQDCEQTVPFEDILGTLSELIEVGKLRFIGVCNETPWGLMRYLETANEYSYPRIASIQHPYNLLNRTFESGYAEIAVKENCSLLAYSPLAHGVLTGKYRTSQSLEGTRFSKYPFYKRYKGERASEAAERYVELAKKHNCGAAQMALSYVVDRPFLASALIAVSNLDQLAQNCLSADMHLSPELIEEIDNYHMANPNPAP